MLRTMPQRTAESLRTAPAPRMAPLIVCVVETGGGHWRARRWVAGGARVRRRRLRGRRVLDRLPPLAEGPWAGRVAAGHLRHPHRPQRRQLGQCVRQPAVGQLVRLGRDAAQKCPAGAVDVGRVELASEEGTGGGRPAVLHERGAGVRPRHGVQGRQVGACLTQAAISARRPEVTRLITNTGQARLSDGMGLWQREGGARALGVHQTPAKAGLRRAAAVSGGEAPRGPGRAGDVGGCCVEGWAGAGSNRRPSAFQADARTD